jgi:hypothetical protein
MPSVRGCARGRNTQSTRGRSRVSLPPSSLRMYGRWQRTRARWQEGYRRGVSPRKARAMSGGPPSPAHVWGTPETVVPVPWESSSTPRTGPCHARWSGVGHGQRVQRARDEAGVAARCWGVSRAPRARSTCGRSRSGPGGYGCRDRTVGWRGYTVPGVQRERRPRQGQPGSTRERCGPACSPLSHPKGGASRGAEPVRGVACSAWAGGAAWRAPLGGGARPRGGRGSRSGRQLGGVQRARWSRRGTRAGGPGHVPS